MGMLDMLGMFGGDGLGDIEKIGKDFVAFMANVQASQAAILSNQSAIMDALNIADKFTDGKNA
jgi:hypothetical protein